MTPKVIHLLMIMYTFLTDGKTYGFPLSSLYVPAPRFTLFGLESFLNASVKPRIASGGPSSTCDHQLKHKKC